MLCRSVDRVEVRCANELILVELTVSLLPHDIVSMVMNQDLNNPEESEEDVSTGFASHAQAASALALAQCYVEQHKSKEDNRFCFY
ncbi:hypothetical protein AVEN_268901-1 [Araneus ventricosus]|uniref:Uncharacterized protein n=1 Tax=Araneus ventricosus TaxID=182803 RepID=A0A4Y2VIU6_ARAVE|nr:hypothetical protein AVEN_268901-1 [Araneus ventricosus]